MVNVIYNLPEITFVGGETQNLMFCLLRDDGSPFVADECSVNFAMTRISNKAGIPEIIKEASVIKNKDGIYNLATVELTSDDTNDLSGRFVYQITVKSDYGRADIPGHGIIDITRNINPDYVTL